MKIDKKTAGLLRDKPENDSNQLGNIFFKGPEASLEIVDEAGMTRALFEISFVYCGTGTNSSRTGVICEQNALGSTQFLGAI